MGAIKPWHLLICSTFCLLVVTAVVTVVVLLIRRGRTGNPPDA